MFGLNFGGDFSTRDAARLRRVEEKLDLILEHLGLTHPSASNALDAEVRELADSGNKIAAIKRHRELYGSSLVEAKEAVEDHLRTSGR